MLSLSVIFLSLAIGRIGWCQNTLYSIQNMDTRKSIVREYKVNVFVVFNVNQGNSFNLVDVSSMTVESIDMMSIDVNDFEIYNDFVYFCGLDAGVPCVGWFEISTVFSGGSMVETGTLPTLICTEYSPNNHVFTDVKKIEVMDIGGSIHLLIVGRAQCGSNPGQTDGFFAEVYFNGSTFWIESTLEHSGILYYDDVAVTDNYVVPVGHKNGSNGEYIYALAKQTVPTTSLFSANNPSPYSPIIGHTAWAYGGAYCYIVDGSSEFIIEHITDDIFATACYGKCIPSSGGGYVYGTIFNLYNGVGTVNGRYCVPPYNYVYRDFRYNKKTRSLYLLPGTGSSAPSDYLEFFIDPTFSFVTGVSTHIDFSATEYSSLDACVQSSGHAQAVLSGKNKLLTLWQNNPIVENNCSKTITTQFETETCGQNNSFKIDICYEGGSVALTYFYPPLSNYSINIDCFD